MVRVINPCLRVLFRLSLAGTGLFAGQAVAQTGVFYDHGAPTVEEQLMLERVNRARADPGAEAARLGIDLNAGLAPGTIADTPKPPLAMHPDLIGAARFHSDWMLAADVFDHTGSGGSSAGDRMEAAGYVFSGSWTWGENIAWQGTQWLVDSVKETLEAHDGLFISPGHRENLMYAGFDEIGIGIREGVFTDGDDWNALMATQNFARSDHTPGPLAVGSAFYDFNGNGMYDAGEGIGGVQVEVSGSGYYTQTSSPGGYALPIPLEGGARVVTFSAGGVSMDVPAVFPAGENFKVDAVPPYSPPVLSGPATAVAGMPNPYTFTRVFGADGYRVVIQRREAAVPDGAEDLTRVINGTSFESLLSTETVFSGSRAYHLAHPGISTEWLTYANPFRVEAGAMLGFRSRLRYATPDQEAQVRVSADGGMTWDTVYAQAGSGGPGEGAFLLRELDLSAYAGQEVRIAFVYVFEGGSYYGGADSDVGWFVDAVTFANLLEIEAIGEEVLGTEDAFLLETAVAGESLWLQAVPLHQGAAWPGGPALAVETVAADAYHEWAAEAETLHGLPAGSLVHDPHGDVNGDGTANSLAFVLGLEAVSGSVSGADLPSFGGDGAYAFWTREEGPWEAVPELSVDLQTWFAWDDPALPGSAGMELLGVVDGMAQYKMVPGADLGAVVLVRLRLRAR